MSPSNIAISVRSRLLNKARESKRPFQELLQYYALERFLYRLSVSSHRERFVLKGALMLRAWNAPMMRPTKDIDLLGETNNSIENLEEIVRDICKIVVEEDGMFFNESTVRGELIKENSIYNGVRIKFKGQLENARVPMQIDVGFDDAVFPSPEENTYPVMLEFEAPKMKMYPREAVIAEKFQTMVERGTLNSRMKDFFDIYILSKQFQFDSKTLATAIKQTFKNRNTKLANSSIIFNKSFANNENINRQWHAFLKKGIKGIAPDDFREVLTQIKKFLSPIL